MLLCHSQRNRHPQLDWGSPTRLRHPQLDWGSPIVLARTSGDDAGITSHCLQNNRYSDKTTVIPDRACTQSGICANQAVGAAEQVLTRSDTAASCTKCPMASRPSSTTFTQPALRFSIISNRF